MANSNGQSNGYNNINSNTRSISDVDRQNNGSSANGSFRKREAPTDTNGQKQNGERVKKFRWDDGPAVVPPSSNGHQSYNRSNNSTSNNNNNQAYGPYPVSQMSMPSKNDSMPPLPPPPAPSMGAIPPPPPTQQNAAALASSHQNYHYPADYSQMYNLQYYQAIAAAAAANGTNWQATAAYAPPLPPNPIKTPQ